ncbi:peroxin 20 [Diaporthe helianthi]|uniref:Peroxin 20 n=1 Tax=Diaporthe helianthi TaxID=158607 RepID=A0A2P5IC39_DIAHE|nr:peroxin 20 [Diaporthe helianthi]
MSDNLCGPSVPTKGLLGHLDRDRTLQQDRVAGSPASAAGSFRSNTQGAPNTAAGDASFANFTGASPQPNPQASADPRAVVKPRGNPNHNPFLWRQYQHRYRGHVDKPLEGREQIDLENHVNPPIPARRGGIDHQRPSAALQPANTSWVHDFKRAQEETSLSPEMGALRLNPMHALPATTPYGQPGLAAPRSYHFPIGQPMTQGNVATPYAPSHMMPAHAPPGFFPGFAQGGQQLIGDQPAQEDQVAPHGYSAPGTAQAGANGLPFSHYPQNLALAANTEEALGAAFAAYDQDFEQEMDQWVAAHGPEDREDHEAVMTEHADKLDAKRRDDDPAVLSQLDPNNRFMQKKREDFELQSYAARILDTMVSSDNEKFRGSSFTDLMRRIVNREVVVEGDDLIDVATGNPTDLTPRDLKPVIQVPGIPPTFIPPSDAELRSKKEAESKGKGPAAAENSGTA